MTHHETRLSTRQTISDLVASYDKSVADLRDGFRLIASAQAALGSTFGRDKLDKVYVCGRHGDRPNFDDVDSSLEAIRRMVWSKIVDRTEVRSLMSIEAKKKLDAQLEREQLPEVTVENINAMLNGFRMQADDMLKESVDEVFNFLRPRNSKLKTNSELEVPHKVILSAMVESTWRGESLRVRNYQEQKLVALENVMHSLQGKGSICKTWNSQLSNAIEKASEGETDLFRYRACGNGNLHLTFKDRDVLARFNQLAGGARLRPAAHDTKRRKA